MRRPPRAPLLAALAAVACASPGPPTARALRTGEARGQPVVVAVVVDQLAAWIARDRLPLLPATGGFARLRREGTWVKDLRFLHALTETAPGHAALFTGRTPRETGFVANAVVREDLPDRRVASLLEDPGATLAGVSRRAPGTSLARLDGDTVADALRARDPAAVVVSLSLKDRAAMLGAGRRPTWAAWLDRDGNGGAAIVTTSAYPGLPAWLAARAPDIGPSSPLVWSPGDADFLAAHVARADDRAGEDAGVFGTLTFPHAVAAARDRWHAYRASPMVDDLLVDLALESVRRERDPAHPMLVSVSLSGNDYVGHAFGPDSLESWDELWRVDAALARLEAGLDRAVGPAGWALVLSADHGVAPLPEEVAAVRPPWCAPGAADPYERPCAPGVRVDEEAVRSALEVAASRALGAPGDPGRPRRWVEAFEDPFAYLSPEARALPAARRAALEAALVHAAVEIPGIDAAFAISGLAGPCAAPGDEGLRALACRTVRPGIGDLFLAPGPGSFFWTGRFGTSHGTPFLYDRAVPLLARLPGAPGGHEVETGAFGSYRATVWYALTGEASEGRYGGVVGR